MFGVGDGCVAVYSSSKMVMSKIEDRECGRLCFFFNDTATTEIYTLSLHDALPISHLLVWLGKNCILFS